MDSIRAITATDLPALSILGLDQTIALRAMAQEMGWLCADNGVVAGAATAYLADGTVFLDGLVGDEPARHALIDHALHYARWSDAPAVTLLAPEDEDRLSRQGFVALDGDHLPPDLNRAAGRGKILMRRL